MKKFLIVSVLALTLIFNFGALSFADTEESSPEVSSKSYLEDGESKQVAALHEAIDYLFALLEYYEEGQE